MNFREAFAGRMKTGWGVAGERKAGTETTPNQGSRALIIQQTCRGLLSALPKSNFVSKFSFCIIFQDLQQWHISSDSNFFTAKNSNICRLLEYLASFGEMFSDLLQHFAEFSLTSDFFSPRLSYAFVGLAGNSRTCWRSVDFQKFSEKCVSEV